MNSVVGVIAIGTSVVLALILASVVEYATHRLIFTTIAGAIGGWGGQRIGRSFSGIFLDRHDEWLSRLKFEQVYRMHFAYSHAILLVSIICGSAIGFSINYCVSKRTKVPVVNEHQETTNK